MLEVLGPLATFCFSASMTPGPNNIMLTASGATYGFRRTLPHMLGIALGFPLMVLALGLGLGTLFQAFPLLQEILKFVGAGYLLYLAWRIATSGRTKEGHSGDQVTGRPFTFLQAAGFQWVNPKAWVMGLGAVTAFSVLGASAFANAAMIAGAFFATALISVSTWAAFGAAIGRLLKSERALRMFNLTMGGLTALSVVLIFV